MEEGRLVKPMISQQILWELKSELLMRVQNMDIKAFEEVADRILTEIVKEKIAQLAEKAR